MTDIVELLNRAGGSEVLRGVMLGHERADRVCVEAAREIQRLRDVVEAAYIEGALAFGGFSQETADKALARYKDGSDSSIWRNDANYWAECQEEHDQ